MVSVSQSFPGLRVVQVLSLGFSGIFVNSPNSDRRLRYDSGAPGIGNLRNERIGTSRYSRPKAGFQLAQQGLSKSKVGDTKVRTKPSRVVAKGSALGDPIVV